MQNVHYPLQAPEHEQLKYKWIKDQQRQDYAAMLAATDKARVKTLELIKVEIRPLWFFEDILFSRINSNRTHRVDR